MQNPYWKYVPSYYRRPNYRNLNYENSNFQNHIYYKNEKHPKQYPYSCIIEDKYCDYFDLGDTAPHFTLDAIVNDEKTKVTLSDYIGKWVLLFFYGSNFTFV